MSQNTTREMLLKMRERYRRRGREGRTPARGAGREVAHWLAVLRSAAGETVTW